MAEREEFSFAAGHFIRFFCAMNLRFLSTGGVAFLAMVSLALGDDHPPATPPGPVQTQDSTNAQPSTPAPPQANAKSAPGAQAANGSNGVNLNGQPITKSPNTPKKPEQSASAAPASTNSASATPPPKPANAIFETYLKDLNDTLKLTPDVQKDIQTYYETDGPHLKDILNDPSLSPLQEDQQVSDLRDQRNAKIVALLQDPDRQREFFKVEAGYRVALIESAADGGLVPAQTPAPAPAPTQTTPGQAEPIPTKNSGAL
jgi:hypothetical protein